MYLCTMSFLSFLIDFNNNRFVSHKIPRNLRLVYIWFKCLNFHQFNWINSLIFQSFVFIDRFICYCCYNCENCLLFHFFPSIINKNPLNFCFICLKAIFWPHWVSIWFKSWFLFSHNLLHLISAFEVYLSDWFFIIF